MKSAIRSLHPRVSLLSRFLVHTGWEISIFRTESDRGAAYVVSFPGPPAQRGEWLQLRAGCL